MRAPQKTKRKGTRAPPGEQTCGGHVGLVPVERAGSPNPLHILHHTHLFCLAAFTLSSVQFSSVAQSCPTLWDPRDCNTPGLPVHHQHQKFTQTHVHWVGDAIQTSHPLSSPTPPAPNPSQHQGLFQWVTPRIRWPKYWSFIFSISPSSEHPGLISFRMDWLHLFEVQGALKSLLQHHSSKASILRHSA